MRSTALLFAAALTACALSSDTPPDTDDEASDFDPVPDDGKADGLGTFNQNNVLPDELLVDDTAMDAADVQAFLEDSPYGGRSWLADATVGGGSFADAVVAAAHAEHIHPLVLIARMQVESSGVSKHPGATTLKHALGCGCPDGGGCAASYSGLGNQLACAAHVLRTLYDASEDGSGEWRKGHTRKTLDPKSVTPATNATAALYGYTPWVLVGRGGTWLAWNVTRKFVAHAEALGLLH